MARSVWTGSLSFGLVNVPVALFTATEAKSVRFHQFQAGTSDRVRNKRVNERTGEEVAYGDIVKGYDLGGGEYVMVTPDELTALAPGRSRTIDVSAFVDLGEIDPVYFDRPYYLAPPAKGAGKGTERAYVLLREAMASAGKAALATFVMREKQYLVAIRPHDDVLVLETLLYPDEVRDPVAEIDTLPLDADFDQRELEMARMLIDSMTTDWEPERYHDEYRQRLEQLIEQKRSGAVVAVEPPAPEGAPVVDLLQALEASLRASRGAPAGTQAAPGPPAAPAPRGARASRAGAASDGRGSGAGAKGSKGRSRPSHSTPVPAAGVRRAAASVAATPDDDLTGMAKTELMRRAADLDVPGRSRMTRDQLEEAVRSAGGRRRKAS